MPASDTAPIPLHLILGTTIFLVQLAVEIEVYAHGEAARLEFAVAFAEVLRTAAEVAPAPTCAGSFEGKERYRTVISLPIFDHVQKKKAQGDPIVAFRSAYGVWARLLPIFNRADVVADIDIYFFMQSLAHSVDMLPP